jgi:hypothetical protein
MTQAVEAAQGRGPATILRALGAKEDIWAIWIGLSIVLASGVLFTSGASLRWLAVLPPKWSDPSQIAVDLAQNWPRYGAQFLFWLAAFSLSVTALGQQVRRFVPAFALLYLAAYGIFILGQWEGAVRYNLEPPLVALFTGLVIANSVRLPLWLTSAL